MNYNSLFSIKTPYMNYDKDNKLRSTVNWEFIILFQLEEQI